MLQGRRASVHPGSTTVAHRKSSRGRRRCSSFAVNHREIHSPLSPAVDCATQDHRPQDGEQERQSAVGHLLRHSAFRKKQQGPDQNRALNLTCRYSNSSCVSCTPPLVRLPNLQFSVMYQHSVRTPVTGVTARRLLQMPLTLTSG